MTDLLLWHWPVFIHSPNDELLDAYIPAQQESPSLPA